MDSQLISARQRPASSEGSPSREYRDAVLDLRVADLMTPGCVVISDTASVADAAGTMARHRVHAVLVVGSRNGTPLGWITHRGLMGWIGRDRSDARASEAITEQVRAISPEARIQTARYALSQAGSTRLLVRRRPDQSPEGVLSDFDLALAVGR
jgi:CBS domain-containing protein